MLQPPGGASRTTQRVARRKTQESPDDMIRALQRLPGNKKCADCSSKLPQCANLTVGSFVCMACSGVLRESSHKIKGIGHSSFLPEEVDFMTERGNDHVNQVYLARYVQANERLKPPQDNSDLPLLRLWIRRKYTEKAWYREGPGEPPKQEPQPTRAQIPAAPAPDLLGFDTAPPPAANNWDSFGGSTAQPAFQASFPPASPAAFQANFANFAPSPQQAPPQQGFANFGPPQQQPQGGFANFNQPMPPQQAGFANFNQQAPPQQPPPVPPPQQPPVPPPVPPQQPPPTPQQQPPPPQQQQAFASFGQQPTPQQQMQQQPAFANFQQQGFSNVPPATQGFATFNQQPPQQMQGQPQQQMQANQQQMNGQPQPQQQMQANQQQMNGQPQMQANQQQMNGQPQPQMQPQQQLQANQQQMHGQPQQQLQANQQQMQANQQQMQANQQQMHGQLQMQANQQQMHGQPQQQMQANQQQMHGPPQQQMQANQQQMHGPPQQQMQANQQQMQAKQQQIHGQPQMQATQQQIFGQPQQQQVPPSPLQMHQQPPQQGGAPTQPANGMANTGLVVPAMSNERASAFEALSAMSIGSADGKPQTADGTNTPAPSNHLTSKYQEGQSVIYRDSQNNLSSAEIVKVHFDDQLDPFYTIKLPNGKEKQTDDGHLTLSESSSLQEQIVNLLPTFAPEHLRQIYEYMMKLKGGGAQSVQSQHEAVAPSPIPSGLAPATGMTTAGQWNGTANGTSGPPQVPTQNVVIPSPTMQPQKSGGNGMNIPTNMMQSPSNIPVPPLYQPQPQQQFAQQQSMDYAQQQQQQQQLYANQQSMMAQQYAHQQSMMAQHQAQQPMAQQPNQPTSGPPQGPPPSPKGNPFDVF